MKVRFIFLIFAFLLCATSVGIFIWWQARRAVQVTTSDPPIPHLSDDEHWNYLIFFGRCGKGFKVSDWHARYDNHALYSGLFQQWVQQTGNPRGITESNYTAELSRILDNTFGGIQNTNDYQTIVNCDGDPVEIHAYMRTRLVSTGFAAEVLRIYEGLPRDTAATVALYQKHTDIIYTTNTCSGGD